MNLTDANVREVYETIGAVAARPLPFKLSYRLTKIVGQLETAYKSTETARMDLIKSYDETGTKVPQDKVNEFSDKFTKALEENSSDYSNLSLIPLSLFEGLNIEVQVLKSLAKLIDENA
jgi:hypothetical protein